MLTEPQEIRWVIAPRRCATCHELSDARFCRECYRLIPRNVRQESMRCQIAWAHARRQGGPLPGPVYKVISLMQPWASFVMLGMKEWETRSRSMGYAGPVLVHASLTKVSPEVRSALDSDREFVSAMAESGLSWDKTPRGVILGIVEMHQALRTHVAEGLFWPSKRELSLGDWSRGRVAIRMRRPRRLVVPVPAAGALGIWEWAGDLEARGAGWR